MSEADTDAKRRSGTGPHAAKGATGTTGGPAVRSVHRGETFRQAVLRVDGRHFDGCRFEGCRLVYGGGVTPIITACQFDNCSWSFADGAANTLAMLAGLAQGGFAPVVEPTLEAIRTATLQVSQAGPAGSPQRFIDLGFGTFPVPRVVMRNGGGQGKA